MTQRSAAHHCITELVYHSADECLSTVTFTSASASQPGSAHYVSLDIFSGETLCTCKGAECGRECWHMTLVQAAWDAHPARTLASQYTADQLAQAGRKASIMCNSYRTHGTGPLPADQVALVACRSEYARRKRAREAAEAGRVAA